MKVMLLATLTCALFCCVEVGFAQQEGGARARNGQRNSMVGPNQRLCQMLCRPPVAKKIGVPPEVIAKIRAELNTLALQERPIRMEINKRFRASSQLAKQVLSDKAVTPEALIRATEEISALQAKLALLDIQKLLILRDNLTPDQCEALLAYIQDERRGNLRRSKPQLPKNDAK